MRKRKWLIMCAILTVLVFSVVAISGCGADAPVGNNADGAFAETFHWTIATSWPSGIMLQDMPRIWAERVEQMSGGRLIIDVEPAGAIVGAMEILDATHAGTIDGFHSWSGYWMGQHEAQIFFASIPMTMEPLSHVMWMWHEGLEYQNRIYQEEMGLNVVAFLGGNTHPELGAMATYPLAELDDWRGTRFRVPGWMAEILTDMGVAVVALPGAEVYPSLERGVIDAAEFSSPLVNHQLGFHEITDYFTGPGFHQPSCLFEITINKDAYEALPPDLQYIVEYAALVTTMESWTIDVVEGIRILELWEEDYGLTPVRMSNEAQLEFRKQAWDFIDARVQDDPLTKEIWDSARNFFIEFNDYEDFMVPIRDLP